MITTEGVLFGRGYICFSKLNTVIELKGYAPALAQICHGRIKAV